MQINLNPNEYFRLQEWIHFSLLDTFGSLLGLGATPKSFAKPVRLRTHIVSIRIVTILRLFEFKQMREESTCAITENYRFPMWWCFKIASVKSCANFNVGKSLVFDRLKPTLNIVENTSLKFSVRAAM
ncbi:hypothetical protein TNCT_601191 [Trichonephila clavata]|uniref:Uncharacterized protein n=1 Tax=Trichonephila clavata TaxID=2740835 RepID=A0A8X6G7K1_TRICU|nr:hypothetical protein TNCT_601191 [Trichonephila clavata]